LKILILKPSSLGDVIQALPVLRLLKLQLPSAEIFWWIDSALASLLEGDPDLSGVVRFERRRWAKPRYWPELLQSIHSLRAKKFDLIIDLQSLLRSGAIGWLANGKQFIGLDDDREGANAFYDRAVPRANFHTHAVDWYLSVLPVLGFEVHQDFNWLPERPAVSAEVKSKWNTTGKKWIALQPGARWQNKRWPVRNFSALTTLLAARFPETHFAILGGKDDQALGETISQALPSRCLNLCGATTLPEMIEWLRLADLLVTNDTGPMHAAAALGKPLIALFGPTEPRRTGPYGQLQNVVRIDLPCSPCLKPECHFEKREECLRAITPETVARKVEQLLGNLS
jgi:heptosyltransferase-1